MRFLFTKSFPFSASHTRGSQVFGHNYILSVTVRTTEDDSAEARMIEVIEKDILLKVHSRDLGENITLSGLLRTFWKDITPKLLPFEITSLVLERDARTRAEFLPEKS